MSQIKVKEEFIGSTTNLPKLGMHVIQKEDAELLARFGKTQYLTGIVPAKKLVAIRDKKADELNEIAKDLPGYKKGMKKSELIELISAAPKS